MRRNLLNSEHKWKLLDWIPKKKLDDINLLKNERAIFHIEKNWESLSSKYYFMDFILQNDNAFHLIDNLDKIKNLKYNQISRISSAYHILKNNRTNINPVFLAKNRNINILEDFLSGINGIEFYLNELCQNEIAIKFIEPYINILKPIHWMYLSGNKNAINILENNLDKIDWFTLSGNSGAMDILEKNKHKIFYENLSFNRNPRAMILIEENIRGIKYDINGEKIECESTVDWQTLSSNPVAINIIKDNLNKVCWSSLCFNFSAEALEILKYNQDKIDWITLSRNPYIYELNLDFIHCRNKIIFDELIKHTWKPNRIIKWCFSIDELIDFKYNEDDSEDCLKESLEENLEEIFEDFSEKSCKENSISFTEKIIDIEK